MMKLTSYLQTLKRKTNLFKQKKAGQFSSAAYWDNRYVNKETSGAGSYGEMAKYKANFINKFVKTQKIETTIEFGSGDGNQLGYYNFQSYMGLDVSQEAIKICLDKFGNDPNKSFYLYHPHFFRDNIKLFSGDLAISIEVIFHLVENEIFEKYILDLFNSANKYVIIFSSNYNQNVTHDGHGVKVDHVKHRNFTEAIKRIGVPFDLVEIAETPKKLQCFSNFHVYKKV